MIPLLATALLLTSHICVFCSTTLCNLYNGLFLDADTTNDVDVTEHRKSTEPRKSTADELHATGTVPLVSIKSEIKRSM